MSAPQNPCVDALETLLQSLQQDAADVLVLDIDTLERRIILQAQQVRECASILSSASPDHFDRQAVLSLVAGLSHQFKVYRGVVRAGLRSSAAVLQAISPDPQDAGAEART